MTSAPIQIVDDVRRSLGPAQLLSIRECELRAAGESPPPDFTQSVHGI